MDRNIDYFKIVIFFKRVIYVFVDHQRSGVYIYHTQLENVSVFCYSRAFCNSSEHANTAEYQHNLI